MLVLIADGMDAQILGIVVGDNGLARCEPLTDSRQVFGQLQFQIGKAALQRGQDARQTRLGTMTQRLGIDPIAGGVLVAAIAYAIDLDMRELVHALAEGRQKTDQEIRGLIDHGPFLPEDAVRAGLIDDVAYEDELDDKVELASGTPRWLAAFASCNCARNHFPDATTPVWPSRCLRCAGRMQRVLSSMLLLKCCNTYPQTGYILMADA